MTRYVLIAALGLALGCGKPKEDDDKGSAGFPLAPGGGDATPSENRTTGPLKPFKELSRTLEERLFARDGALDLKAYFIDPPDPDDIFGFLKPSLVELLGAFDGDGTRVGLRNATPNAVNMLLWYMILEGLAGDLGNACTPDAAASLAYAVEDVKPELRDALARLCSSRDDDTLRAVWDAVMRTDASEEEFQSWRNFLQSEAFAVDGAAAVRDGLVAMTYNPYFLLQP